MLAFDRVLGRWKSLPVAWVGIGLYALLAGASPGVIRAVSSLVGRQVSHFLHIDRHTIYFRWNQIFRRQQRLRDLLTDQHHQPQLSGGHAGSPTPPDPNPHDVWLGHQLVHVGFFDSLDSLDLGPSPPDRFCSGCGKIHLQAVQHRLDRVKQGCLTGAGKEQSDC